MLIINGHKFVKNEKEAINTLFQKDGTFYGFYKCQKNSVILSNMQNKVFAAVVCTPHFSGIVNASKMEKGAIHYQFAACEKTEKLLGVPRYIEQADYAHKIFKQAKGI